MKVSAGPRVTQSGDRTVPAKSVWLALYQPIKSADREAATAMPDIISITCIDSALPAIERDLAARGFRLVDKTNEKELMPNEYMKSSHSGTSNSFEGPRKWTITRRIR